MKSLLCQYLRRKQARVLVKMSKVNRYDPSSPGILRVSKSSFMQYLSCPRQWWFNYVTLYDLKTPRTEAMIRGTVIHQVMEDALTPTLDVRPIPVAVAEEAAKTDYAHDLGVQNQVICFR